MNDPVDSVSMMRHAPRNPDSWPRLMRAETAAAYLDEVSAPAFRRAVGTLYPAPISVPGKGERWLRDDLDEAIERMTGRAHLVRDADAVL